ncbi:MAG TPA: choice-of-anchor J domain-containing protein [Candidatus Cloacimonadota bacterium]|nr:choice-of-anchor J domain-containing protein [Candidatus Cloacimonadota bacterium]
MSKVLLFLLLACVLPLSAVLVQVGSDEVEDQGLPWTVTSRYSYVQQLYPGAEIGVSGQIQSLAFQYMVGSNVFFEANRSLSIRLGQSTLNELTDWIPAAELSLVYQGDLNLADFSGDLPGNGWLTIELPTPFNYDCTQNLVIAIDENSGGYGATNDDFFSSPQSLNRALRFRSMSINPDPQNPPASSVTALPYLANLRLEIETEPFTPRSPQPQHQAVEVEAETGLAWQSQAASFDLCLGTDPAQLDQVATDLSTCSWQPQPALQEASVYYWKVIAHEAGEDYPGPVWQFSTSGAPISAPRELSAEFTGNAVQLSWLPPLSGLAVSYQIQRNGEPLGLSSGCSYRDTQISSGAHYSYQVRARDADDQYSPWSDACELQIPQIDPDLLLQEGFEFYPAFSTELSPWANLDMDASATWAWDSCDFPGEGEALPWLVFRPGQAVPPLSFTAHTGSAMLCSISSLNPPSNDWLISPVFHLGSSPELKFYARSHTSAYGLERLRVLISSGSDSPADFTPISPEPYLQVPEEWTFFQYDLSAWQQQNIRLAWQALSWDSFALYLDDLELRSQGGSSNQDSHAPQAAFRLYPNPGRNYFILETTQREAYLLEVFDLRGRLIHSSRQEGNLDSRELDLKLRSGLYFLKLTGTGPSQILKFLKLP